MIASYSDNKKNASIFVTAGAVDACMKTGEVVMMVVWANNPHISSLKNACVAGSNRKKIMEAVVW